MRDLRKLQEHFAHSMYGATPEAQFLKNIIPGGKLTPERALEVYRKGYPARLTDALGETYESIWWCLGDEDFFTTCEQYIKKTPSQSYDLSDYGKTFPKFLKSHREIDSFPFLPSLAEFEWAFRESFHARRRPGIGHEEVQRVQENPELKFVFDDSVQFLSSPYAIYELWKQRKVPAEEQGEFEWRRPQHLFLYRLATEVYVKEISPIESRIYNLMKEGYRLKEVFTVEGESSLSPKVVSQAFETLLRAQAITALV